MENIRELVDRAVELDGQIKAKTVELNEVKAMLQAEGLRELENKNIRFLQYFGDNGTCEVGYKQKMEVDNFGRLVEVLGDIVTEKASKKEEVKYDFDKKFKTALMCLYLGDFKRHDLEKILLVNLGITEEKQRKMLLKKLKGEYTADRKLLSSVGVTNPVEEELDAIREQRNFELVTRFFVPESVDMEQLKRCISIEDTLSLGLTYQK
ncbi:MAG: hypothetical protein Q4A29_03915 [Eubacteriales bacterium]|nr:hypothetical protein [Eubacteriales bacterium]